MPFCFLDCEFARCPYSPLPDPPRSGVAPGTGGDLLLTHAVAPPAGFESATVDRRQDRTVGGRKVGRPAAASCSGSNCSSRGAPRASPRSASTFPRRPDARPLIVVLDDSFSMGPACWTPPQAGRGRRCSTTSAVSRRRSVRFVLAGERPQVLGGAFRSTSEIESLLEEGWACRSGTARLDSADRTGPGTRGESSTVLVLTDHAPNLADGGTGLRWWSLGAATPNWSHRQREPHRRPARRPAPARSGEPLERNHASTTLGLEAGQPPTELKRRN